MSKFEQLLRLWMCSHGMDQEACDKVCQNRRIAMSIQHKDGGGIVQDIQGTLPSLRV